MDQVWVQVLVALITGLFTAIGAMVKAFKFVHEGQRGIKLRFGRALRDREGRPRIIEPGFVFLIPFVNTLVRRHVRQQTIDFEKQKVTLKDGLIFEISAIVVFRVTDVYRALFEIDHLDASVEDICRSKLLEVIQKRTFEDVGEAEAIASEVLSKLKEVADAWGVEFIDCRLTDSAPTPETSNLINAKVGAKLRLEALQVIAGGEQPVNPTLAAVLVGYPLLATTGDNAEVSDLLRRVRVVPSSEQDGHEAGVEG